MNINGNAVDEFAQQGTDKFALAATGALTNVRALYVITAGSTATSVKDGAGNTVSLGNLVAGMLLPIAPTDITLGTGAVILVLH